MADLGSLLGAAGIGGAIGKAIVQLELETTKYQAELRAAQAQTTASANTMGTGLSSFGGIARTAMLGAGAAVVAFGAFAVKAAVEANEAHLKLQNTFENNPRLADSSVEAFERQADALRQLTGVDDEAIISSQALLGQFKLTGAQVEELTPLIVDLSAKMGVDLEAAAKAVGKATEGNTGALARYIGTIDKGATSTETYTNILEKLGRVQGFAAERAEAEPWRVLGSQLEELAEEVGKNLLPPLIEVASVLVDFVSALGPVLDLVGKLGPAVRILGEAFTFLVSPLARVIDLLSRGIEPTDEMVQVLHSGIIELESMKQKAEIAAGGLEKLGDEVKDLSKITREESKEIRDSFRTSIFVLEDFTTETDVTKRDFVAAIREMKRDAREFADAMENLPKAKWVNDEFIQFISEQGPEWIVGFSNLNKEKQKAMQEDWEESQRTFNRSIKGSFLDLNQSLDDLDKKTTNHTVRVKYEYVGFDPSKPGMSGSGQVR